LSVSSFVLYFAFTEKPYLGFRLPLISTQIVGGSEAPKGAYPYIVSLRWGFSASSATHFCAGSILNENYILTAAHCIDALPGYGSFVIKAGSNSVKSSESGEQIVEVAQSVMHERYGG